MDKMSEPNVWPSLLFIEQLKKILKDVMIDLV